MQNFLGSNLFRSPGQKKPFYFLFTTLFSLFDKKESLCWLGLELQILLHMTLESNKKTTNILKTASMQHKFHFRQPATDGLSRLLSFFLGSIADSLKLQIKIIY